MLNLNYRCNKQAFRQAVPPAPRRNYEEKSGSLKDALAGVATSTAEDNVKQLSKGREKIITHSADALAEPPAGLDGWTQVRGNGSVMLVDKYVDLQSDTSVDAYVNTIDKAMSEFKKAAKKKL